MKILIASSIHADAVEQLKQHHDVISAINAPTDELVAKVRDRELIIFRSGVSITTDVMSAAPNLKFLVRAGSGLDNLDVEYTVKNNIQLVRIPEPGAKAVAELSFAFMLMLSRNLLKADNEWRKGHWIKSEMNGYLLTGKVLGIVGAGNIGSRVGRMGAAWGMNVLGCVEFPSKEIENDLKAQGIKLTTCDEVIRNSDYISIHVPLTDKTRNMINANVLNRMKKGSYLMNLARGGVVNENDLYEALTKGERLRGAALDVHEHEGNNKISKLASLPNVVLTPHIGAQTIDSQAEIGVKVLEAVKEFDLSPREKIRI